MLNILVLYVSCMLCIVMLRRRFGEGNCELKNCNLARIQILIRLDKVLIVDVCRFFFLVPGCSCC